jgi:hypothetical protein
MMDTWSMMGWERESMWGGGLGLILLWSLIWKGIALWKSARNDQRYWFVALLVINTAGILEILYLFIFAKNKLVLVSEPRPVSRPKSKKSAKK